MHEKLIMDMQSEINKTINWIVELKVQHLKDKIQEGNEALSENKWLKKQLDIQEGKNKNLQSWIWWS